MSIFNSLGQQPQQGAQMDPAQALADLKRNPSSFLKQMGLDVPEDMTDPQQITQHLVSSGQRSNSMLQMAMRMMGRR